MIDKIQFITTQFLGEKNYKNYTSLQGGLINKTYLIHTYSKKKYILQQINTSVFKDVAKLMDNLQLISLHLNEKIVENDRDSQLKSFLYYPVISTGKYYFKHTDNSFWRLSDYIENQSIEGVKLTKNTATESGRLFGLFIRLLSDIDLEKINYIIPDFHNTERYYKLLETAIKKDPFNRLKNSQSSLKRIQKQKWLLEIFLEIKKDKTIPLRLTHNDTKATNILFDKTEKAIAIIDLDTCMPGYLMSDFGDAIRSLCNTGKEDAQELATISFDMDLFKTYTEGFLATTNPFILKVEKDNLAVFSLLITYEQAIRFYSDYLNGDLYYQTEYKEHNLQRTKVQLKLLEEMIVKFEEMKAFIESVFS